MIINIVTAINLSGSGKFGSGLIKAMTAAAGFTHKVRAVNHHDTRSLDSLIQRRPSSPQVTIFLWPFLVPGFEHAFNVVGRKILWVVFETDHLPEPWINDYHKFDEIWVPSDWGRSVLIGHGLDPAKVITMPEGIDTDHYSPAPQPHDGIRFLLVGKSEMRKSIDEALLAFLAAFPDPAMPVEFWLKVDNPFFPDRGPALQEKWKHEKRFRFLTGLMPESNMPWLYNQVDALVFPSKAEGFGLPCIEAISCGLPVIATNYSGHSQFLNQMTGRFIPVDYKLAPIEDDDYRSSYSQFYGGQAIGQWAMPDIGSIADGMRRFYDAPAIWRAHAMEAMQKVAPEFAWGAIATRALAQLTGKKP